jgi:iron complex outermembrane receptor protein
LEPQAERIETNPAPTHLLNSVVEGNGLYGATYGTEIFANWKAASFWTLSPGYAFLTAHIHTLASSLDTSSASGTEGGSPNHQAQLRSSISLPWKLQWNASAYFVNCLPVQSIPSYTRLDSSLTWHAGERTSIILGGKNLLRDFHPESNSPNSSVEPGQMRRSAYAKIAWSF